MNMDMVLVFIILAATIVIFIWDKFRIDIVAMLALMSLVLSGIINTNEALEGFANSTVITIAGLFVVGAGLFQTGVADWLGDQLLNLAGSSEVKLMAALMVGTALLSGFMSNTGTVAVLLPAVVAAAWRIKSMPSRLLLPMSFAASIGGMLTLIGTPPNIVITNALKEANLRPFSFFEFSLIGVPLLAIGVIYVVFVARGSLPERKTSNVSRKSTASPEELAKAYSLDQTLFRLRIRRGSSLIGQSLAQAKLPQSYGATVFTIERPAAKTHIRGPQALESIADTFGVHEDEGKISSPGPDTVVQADDILLVEGPPKEVHQMMMDLKLGLKPHQAEGDEHPEGDLLSREIGLAEVLITPRSALIGQTILQARFGEKYEVRVLGISRRGKSLADAPVTEVKLTFGDSLLVHGTWQAIGLLQNESRNFVVVGHPESMVDSQGLSPQAMIALAAMAGMLTMMLTGVVSTVIAVLLTGLVMVLGGCLNMEQAYRAINWESVVLIAAMLPMKTALEVTGGADFIANGLVNTLGAIHPLALMAGIFILTAGFTQVISNTATTVLVAPIAINAAAELGVSAHPLMMMVAVAASSAFLTPIASPVNTLILTPGGYRFSDFMKTGLPLLILFLIVSLIMVPLIWSL